VFITLSEKGVYAILMGMGSISKILPWIQIILSILLIATVLLQQSTASLGSAFGGDSSVTFHTRRGFERFLFIATFVLGALFILSAIAALLVH
jgi:protein translocase SecG subunit